MEEGRRERMTQREGDVCVRGKTRRGGGVERDRVKGQGGKRENVARGD
jgi:hypothetical protein